MLRQIALCSVLLFSGWACKEKLSLNEPWKEIMCIYGFLDQSESIQYVRISKAFMGEGDNSSYAGIPDSVYYDPALIDAVLQEYAGVSGSSLLQTIVLHDTILNDLPSGTFPSAPNRLYYTKQVLNANNTYKLLVKNKKTGNVAQATTRLIGIQTMSTPSFFNVVAGSGADRTYSNFTFTQKAAPNTRSFQCTIQFFYADSFVNGSVNEKMVELKLPMVLLESARGGFSSNQVINGKDFVGFLKSNKDNAFPNNGALRRARGVLLTQTCAGEELTNYYNINKPSSGLLLEKPLYTNISNGVGIFSCRAYKAQGTPQRTTLMGISDGTKQILAADSIGLGFVNP